MAVPTPCGHGAPFHALGVQEVAGRLGTDQRRGLRSDEARARLARTGPNTLRERPALSPLRLLLDQFRDFLVLLLLAAALVSGVLLREVLDAAVILAIVVLNVGLGFARRYRAEQALARLQEAAAPLAQVVRDGTEHRLPAAGLVPGDVIRLHTGDRVPADARISESRHLQLSEAVLTGEPFPEAKSDRPAPAAAPLADRTSMVLAGTTVLTGRGTAIVTATGRATAMGEIAQLLAEPAPATPLQRELARLGQVVGGIAIVIVVAVSALGWVQGHSLQAMFLTAVALAVAAVPEGLPAVITVALARGVQQLASERAIVRRLQAVETLGTVGVICTDKTGTLTRNRIQVESVVLAGLRGPPATLPARDRRVQRLAEVAALCNDTPTATDGGDPIEIALLRAVGELGHEPAAIRRAFPRTDEAPFDPHRKLMSTLHAAPDGGAREALLAVKGAPEAVLGRSTGVEGPSGPAALDNRLRADLQADAAELASRGLRPLALAYRRVRPGLPDLLAAERELVLVAVVGLSDQLRPEAPDAVRTAQAAGIRVVVVTGDHAQTAEAVSGSLGVLAGHLEVMPGERLAALSPEQLRADVHRYGAYARIDPADKVKIVRAWQGRGEVVAMTGDGVNDAPALHAADIGVAMGSGTDVSRDAADMVLADDNFATLVSAVREGRAISDNVRNVIQFLITANASELLVMSFGFLLFGSLGAPLLPPQILWINLVTDGLPVLALASDRPGRDLMRGPARRWHAFGDAGQVWTVLWQAGILGAAALGALVYGHAFAAGDWSLVQTLVFTSLVTLQLGYAFSVRASRAGHLLRGARWLVLATVASLGLQVAVVHLPAGNALFRTVPLGFGDWLAVAGLNGLALALLAAIRLASGARRRHVAVT